MMIEMRGQSDCAVCCFAMLSGWQYEDVLALIGDLYHPKRGTANTRLALERLGYVKAEAPGLDYWFSSHRQLAEHPAKRGSFVQINDPWALSSKTMALMAWGRRALFSVPSLNNEGGWHIIYWDGLRVLDPSRLKKYTDLNQIAPQEVTLFREIRE